jgi:peptidyl-tRNA hydrolase, PTH1 family
MKIIVGLCNPGKEYRLTRHNAGRMAVEYFARKNNFPEFEFSKKYQSLVSENEIKSLKVLLFFPETFMNNSGKAFKNFDPKRHALIVKNLITLHDDIDIAIGKFKISFGRGSGGHKGVESVIRAFKTKNFWRVRIGVGPDKKPPQKEIPKFLLSEFRPDELKKLKKCFPKISSALTIMISDSPSKAMNIYNC